MRDIIRIQSGYTGGTVEVYSDPVGYDPVYNKGVQTGGYWKLETVAPEFMLPGDYRTIRLVTEQELRAACTAGGVPYPAFLEPKGV